MARRKGPTGHDAGKEKKKHDLSPGGRGGLERGGKRKRYYLDL